MATHLVMIEKLAGSDGAIEMYQYIGKKMQVSIATNPKEYDSKQQLLDLIEDFRKNGVKVLA
jgi:hypothetical protein